MKKWVHVATMMLVVGLTGSVWGITIDNNRSDWDASGLLKADPVGDHLTVNSSVADLTKWGVTAQGGYLYVFVEDPQMNTWFDSTNDVFASVLPDVDRTGGLATWGDLPGGKSGWNGPSCMGMRPSYGWPEFSYPVAQGSTGRGIFDGPDAFIEWGPNEEGFNFWGNSTSDNMYVIGNGVMGGATGHGDNFIEFRVPISQIKSEVATYPDHVTPKKVWKCAVRLAAHMGDSNYDGDKSGDGITPNNSSYVTWVYVPVETVMGDINEDGIVNFSDYLLLSQNFNKTGEWSQGDLSGDGVINFSDYLLLSQNFSKTFPGSVDGTTVPEPATLSLIILGGLAMLRRKSA
jgi:hypothetical protein